MRCVLLVSRGQFRQHFTRGVLVQKVLRKAFLFLRHRLNFFWRKEISANALIKCEIGHSLDFSQALSNVLKSLFVFENNKKGFSNPLSRGNFCWNFIFLKFVKWWNYTKIFFFRKNLLREKSKKIIKNENILILALKNY